MKSSIFFLIPAIIQFIATILIFKKWKKLNSYVKTIMLVGSALCLLAIISQCIVILNNSATLTTSWFVYDNTYILIMLTGWIMFSLGLYLSVNQIEKNHSIENIKNIGEN